MIMRIILLFFLVCGITGLGAVLGSMLGNAFSQTALFVGAMIGGMLGVALAGRLARRFKLIASQNYAFTVIGGILGFFLAAFIAVNNLHTPVTPILSTSLVGLGAIVGNFLKKDHSA
ncbi:hypothetical protein L0337_13080 [candidate division KSB1 bacterium]|nr:hypothetical protein [candidate division KSB1 bacterium]